MATTRVRHNIRGYAAVRRAGPLIALEERIAKNIANRCNREAGTDEFRVSSQQGGGRAPRWRTTVITAGARAIRHNATHNTLVRNFRG